MENLPLDIENVILDYKYRMEFDEKNKKNRRLKILFKKRLNLAKFCFSVIFAKN
ncbi:MAG: hypothetical protein ACPGEC_03105 [Flavobacteriales bacterium]